MAVEALGGMGLMGTGSTLLNIQLAILAILGANGWPDWTMLGLSTVIQMVFFIIWIAVTRPSLPAKGDSKWVVLAGVFFVGSFVLMIVSVRLGVPLGDFAALNSANVVFAAFIGRIFLREALRWAHLLAVVCTIGGAILISQPEIIFGRSGDTSINGLGYAVAVISGLCDAFIYISVRKAGETSPWWINLSFTAQAGVVLVGTAPIVDGFPVQHLLATPWESLGWIVLYTCIGLTSLVMFTLASQWCPAAISATVDTATRMVVGYALQVLLFGASLNVPTVLGATLMFSSVAAMTVMQIFADGAATEPVETSASTSQPVENTSKIPPQLAGSTAVCDDESDNESLASFIACEFMGTPLRERALRQRCHAAGNLPPQVVGVMAAVSGAASA